MLKLVYTLSSVCLKYYSWRSWCWFSR